MRVTIAGAGSVGQSIALELLANGYDVLLIEKDPDVFDPDAVPGARWLIADACELSSLERAELETSDVSVAATGDDKANLVYSLLAKTEFSVPRTVGRVNNPRNEWMFAADWGVDVAVSTPRLMAALIEEAVAVGDLVRLMTFGQGTNLVELTLGGDSPVMGQRVADLDWPAQAALVAILREGRAAAPRPDDDLRVGDELLFLSTQAAEPELMQMLAPESPTAPAAPEDRIAGPREDHRE